MSKLVYIVLLAMTWLPIQDGDMDGDMGAGMADAMAPDPDQDDDTTSSESPAAVYDPRYTDSSEESSYWLYIGAIVGLVVLIAGLLVFRHLQENSSSRPKRKSKAKKPAKAKSKPPVPSPTPRVTAAPSTPPAAAPTRRPSVVPTTPASVAPTTATKQNTTEFKQSPDASTTVETPPQKTEAVVASSAATPKQRTQEVKTPESLEDSVKAGKRPQSSAAKKPAAKAPSKPQMPLEEVQSLDEIATHDQSSHNSQKNSSGTAQSAGRRSPKRPLTNASAQLSQLPAGKPQVPQSFDEIQTVGQVLPKPQRPTTASDMVESKSVLDLAESVDEIAEGETSKSKELPIPPIGWSNLELVLAMFSA